MKHPKALGYGPFLFLVAAFIALSGNSAFFQKSVAVYDFAGNWPFLVSLVFVLIFAIVFFAAVFSFVLPVRVVAIVFLILAAVTGYFMDRFGIPIDKEMVRNVIDTDVGEAGDLMTWALAGRVLLLGILPSIVVYFLPLPKNNLFKRQVRIVGVMVSMLVLVALCVLPFGGAYASYVREHKPLRYFSNPTYPIYSVIKLVIDSTRTVDRSYKRRVTSAVINPDDKTRKLVVMVVGEAVRWDHVGLNGYKRQTMPKLAAREDVLSFRDTHSCGTSTAYSVPCMFSLDGRAKFDIDTAKWTENVLDVLHKAGVNILWRDNNSSPHGVTNRLGYQNYRTADLNTMCDVECRDLGMLVGLDDYISKHDGDILIVLHQMGNHGPAYYKRYPKPFEKYQPACQSNELSTCTRQEIANAYDNAILYTDTFLDSVISLLQHHQDKFATSMFYMSDHGESLGENGIYLHGMPYYIAPEAQKHIPFILWTGDKTNIDLAQLATMLDKPFSQDDLSPILLEAFDVIVDGKKINAKTAVLPLKSDYNVN